MLRSALAVMAVVAAFAETIEVARFAILDPASLNFSEASVAACLPFGFSHPFPRFRRLIILP